MTAGSCHARRAGLRALALRALLRGTDVLVIEDDHAAELSPVPLHALAGAGRHWAFLRSVSKPYGPDLRLAVLAGDEATVARVAGRMRVGTGWVSSILQRSVVRLWTDRRWPP
jgi:DNA-binding transcriptional MocR family regulator